MFPFRRLFNDVSGTFEAERSEEKVVYGLVHNIGSWEPVYAQVINILWFHAYYNSNSTE